MSIKSFHLTKPLGTPLAFAKAAPNDFAGETSVSQAEEKMATYSDMDPLPYFGEAFSDSLCAVGWLGRGHRFQTGPMSPSVYQRLRQLLVSPFQPLVAVGSHECELCQHYGEKVGSANLFVPTEGLLLVCPELILHYINAHHYQPPDKFCEAVMACPDTMSMEYKRLFLASGGRALIQQVERPGR